MISDIRIIFCLSVRSDFIGRYLPNPPSIFLQAVIRNANERAQSNGANLMKLITGDRPAHVTAPITLIAVASYSMSRL